jgi:hypothetical protein
MEKEWSGLNEEALKALYEKKLQELNTALLSGAPWEGLRDQRHAVTQLSILITKRQSSHPAEFNNRMAD